MEFEENWSLNECREIAADVALHMGKDQTAFGAFDGGKVVNFVKVSRGLEYGLRGFLCKIINNVNKIDKN